jgi:putative ABC transport system permease protein
VFFLKLIARNVFRAKLRSTLTIVGLVIAILAFGLLQTVVRAWYAGSEAASATRLITRNAISLTFAMPVYYRERIRAIPGVTGVAVSNWFGGVYKEPRNFFAQFAVDAPAFFPMYPEFIFEPDDYQAFLSDRRGAAVGRQLAQLLRLCGRRHGPADQRDLPGRLGNSQYAPFTTRKTTPRSRVRCIFISTT